MKRILLLLTLALGSAAPAAAQSLTDLLRSLFGGSSETAETALPETPALRAAELSGSWFYNKATVAYSGDDMLAALAVSALEEPIAGYGAKAGLAAGRDRLVFGRNGRLTVYIDQKKKEGTYAFEERSGKLTFRIAIGEAVEQLTGQASLENGTLKLMFDAREALAAMQAASPKLKQNEQVQAVASMVSSYPGLQIGCLLGR